MNRGVEVPTPTTVPNGNEVTQQPWIAHPALLVTLAAIALRLIVFTSRGDYIAYDEGWYLLLGRSVFDGEGYRLTGLRHTTLSPLFPLLAGAVGAFLGNIVWGGRIVAALAAGLLVWPCWHLFRRVAGPRVALTACILIAVMPSLTPFAAPYWIEWDLWVGAEPVLHLFMFSAFAFTLRARDRSSTLDAVLAGAAFALAYLARPEAIIVFGIAGVAIGTAALVRRSPRRIAQAVIMALAFAVIAAPYWFYLHDTLGRWALSGRAVELPARRQSILAGDTSPQPGVDQRRGSARGIERMLWQDENTPYVRVLYGLDDTGTRLSSTYWGVPEPLDSAGPAPLLSVAPVVGAPVQQDSVTNRIAAPSAQDSVTNLARPRPPGRWALHARALGTVVPWFLWPLIVVGIPGRRSAWRDELLIAVPVVLTSVAVARMVGADPRTQLLIVPLAALYAAWGICRAGDAIQRRSSSAGLRHGFVAGATTFIIASVLLSTVGRWVYLGLSMGSPHHTVGAANRAMGAALRELTPANAPVMSWHPAIALYADRAWRVLPYAPLEDIIRYADASDVEHVVLSAYYPGSQYIRDLAKDHVLLRVTPAPSAGAVGIRIEIEAGGEVFILGTVRYLSATAGGGS